MLHGMLKKYVALAEDRKNQKDDIWFMKKHYKQELAARAINRHQVNCPSCKGNKWTLINKTEKTHVKMLCLLCGVMLTYDFRVMFAHLLQMEKKQAEVAKSLDVEPVAAPTETPAEVVEEKTAA